MKAAAKAKLIQYINNKYPDQLGSPEEKKRKTFSRFGYGSTEFVVPIFPITKFLQRNHYGYQRYGKRNRVVEHNSVLYTCCGGFIDFSHICHGIDLTVHLCFKILDNSSDINLNQMEPG